MRIGRRKGAAHEVMNEIRAPCTGSGPGPRSALRADSVVLLGAGAHGQLVYGRPRFAKGSMFWPDSEQIAPVYPDFWCGLFGRCHMMGFAGWLPIAAVHWEVR